MSRRIARGRALAMTLVLAALACERAVPADGIVSRLRALERPNVVLVVVDTLRPDWTGPYGDARGATPELSRWAERGVVFEHVLAQSSWTKVSMASLMTSLWPRSHAVRETTDGLGEGALTLAEVFRAAGYRTYGVQSNGWLEQTFGFHQGFERYMFPRGGGGPALRPSIWPHADNVYLEADRLIAAHPPNAPFFLYLHFMDVHEYAAPPDHKRFGEDDRGAYVAAIAWVDEVIQRLRHRLDHAGFLDRSVLVLASDHGETFGEGGGQGHARNVLAPVLRVPLVVRLPFPVEPVRVAAPVRNLDIAPTLLDLAGIPAPPEFEGRSLLPWIAGAGPPGELPAYASLPALLYRDAVLQESLSEGAWTFARNVGTPAEELLFDAAVDPNANVNLVEIERERAEALRSALDAHLAREPSPGAAQTDVRIDPGLAQKLRALGYMQ